MPVRISGVASGMCPGGRRRYPGMRSSGWPFEVADAEGADAVTMRRIARELNAGTMSLYWHIASKEELLDLMIDEIQGGQPLPEPSGDWRQDMHALASNTRQRCTSISG